MEDVLVGEGGAASTVKRPFLLANGKVLGNRHRISTLRSVALWHGVRAGYRQHQPQFSAWSAKPHRRDDFRQSLARYFIRARSSGGVEQPALDVRRRCNGGLPSFHRVFQRAHLQLLPSGEKFAGGLDAAGDLEI